MVDRTERMAAERHLDRSIGPDHEEPRRIAPLRQRRHEVERRVIAPMQILQQQDQRRRQGGDERRDVAQHTLARAGAEPALERLALGRLDHPGDLHEPGRRMATQHVHDRTPAAGRAETSERLEDRQVRLAGAVLLDALPASDQGDRGIDGPLHEPVDEGRLADAGFADDEDDVPPASARRQ